MIDTKTDKNMIIKGDAYRISLLTDRLIRLEYSKSNIFVDSQTQIVVNRKFPRVDFRVEENEESLVIVTKYIRLIYDKKEFSGEGLRININDKNTESSSIIWYYGDANDSLKGTIRTLDGVDGSVDLDEGIISKKLWSTLDDSKSFLCINNSFEERKDKEAIDLYFFAYGLDYLQALKDFYKLSGNTPLLPRFAFGNWWSRFYKYTQESYMQLIDKFEEENIPFNVAILDMDWHLTDIDAKYGTGWTGYTWNKELFPNPRKLAYDLHEKNYKLGLNVHPADGIRAFEENYKDFAKFMDLDIKNDDPILFNITDKRFCEGYFKYIHHRLEKQGVDFWWIDWQQGKNSGKKGLDPLWLLNYLHYNDSGRNKNRGLILSRYAGVGSHRYPIGFSGDTIISWDSLDFQPYFTSTASNIGYTWWSHDIGGHMKGVGDAELFVRWVQFGVFSPIMRLHSSNNEFLLKEPWKYNSIYYGIIKKYLRLRQRLIPYLYTMNLRLNQEGIPLILPLYYYDSFNEISYKYKNEYYFGENLLVCPITNKLESTTGLSKVKVYIPKGDWVDIFTGISYTGDREIEIFRDLENIPVFAKKGTILPLDAREIGNRIDNPKELDLYIFTGEAANFRLAEDGEELAEYDSKKWRFTDFSINNKKLIDGQKEYTFDILPDSNKIGDKISKRKYNLYFYGISKYGTLKIYCDEKEMYSYDISYKNDINALLIELDYVNIHSNLKIIISAYDNYNSTQIIKDKIFKLLFDAKIENDLKLEIMKKIDKLDEEHKNNKQLIIGEILSLCSCENLTKAIIELLTEK